MSKINWQRFARKPRGSYPEEKVVVRQTTWHQNDRGNWCRDTTGPNGRPSIAVVWQRPLDGKWKIKLYGRWQPQLVDTAAAGRALVDKLDAQTNTKSTKQREFTRWWKTVKIAQ